MKTVVVSGFSPNGRIEYGDAFMRTFKRWWPKEVELVVYVEEEIKTPPDVEQRLIWDIPGCRDFIEGHSDPRSNGRESVPGWRKKDERVGYAWRFDAVRFCRQLFIPEHAVSQLEDGDIFAWLDGDVVSYAEVPSELIAHMLQDKDIITLGRKSAATELGFWAIRVGPETRALVRDLADCCRSGSIFLLNEWHSGYVFDTFVNAYKTDGKIKHKSLTSGCSGHVWFQCEIGQYTDHLKGDDRKKRGYSVERNNATPFARKKLLTKKEKRPVRSLESQIDTLKYVLEGDMVPKRLLAVDVGAYRGSWTAIMAQNFKKVVAFEPTLESYEHLVTSAKQYKNIDIHNKAVMDGGGQLGLCKQPRGKKLTGVYFIPDTDGDTQSVCLDQMGLVGCDLLKIDVEGAELLVLKGARKLIGRDKPVIIIEIDGHGKRYGTKDWELRWFLETTLQYEEVVSNHPDYVWVPQEFE